MHFRIILRNWLGVIVPAHFFTGDFPGFELSDPLSVRVAAIVSFDLNIAVTIAKVLAHDRAMSCLGQLHWVVLSPQEWNLR